MSSPSFFKPLNSVSDESCKAVNKDLVISAYNWVVEQLDVALGEFKEFRDGMDIKERKKYDKLVGKQIQTWNDNSYSVLDDVAQKEMDVIIAQRQKDMDDTTARFNNQKKDVDLLVELIEGNQFGAIPKNSKSKNKKNPDLQFKKASQQDENKDAISPQSEESTEHFKFEAGLGFSRQGATSNYSSQGPDLYASRSLQKAGPVDTFLSNGATASPYPPRGATASSFHQAGATATSVHQAGATASSSHQAGATSPFSPRAGAATSSFRPTRAEKRPNSTKSKNATSLMKGRGGDASLDLKDDDCTICFEEMHERDSLHLKNCWHRFHRVCINQWMESPGEGTSRSTCPICRTDIVEDGKSYKLVTKKKR